MTYILHHVRHSRSMRIVWLMEEMGLDYELRDKTMATLKGPDYLAQNSLGTVPALELPAGGLLLESGAIMQYLLAKHAPSPLAPTVADADFPAYLQWLHFSEATLAPWIVQFMGNTRFKPAADRIEAAANEARARVESLLAFLSRELEGRPYVAGSRFTAADIMTAHSLHVANLNGLLESAPMTARQYFERMAARPAFGRAAAA